MYLLQPENILISASGHIKITDFGTAYINTEDATKVIIKYTNGLIFYLIF